MIGVERAMSHLSEVRVMISISISFPLLLILNYDRGEGPCGFNRLLSNFFESSKFKIILVGLFHFVLYYFILFYFILFYFILFYFILFFLGGQVSTVRRHTIADANS